MVNSVTRARDVRFLINRDGMEKGLLKAVERIAEDNEMLRQEMEEVVKTVNKMADIVANIATVGERLRNDLVEIKRKFTRDRDELQ